MEKINKIREQLKSANDAYRKGYPIMSDAEYDVLEQELRNANPDDAWFKKGVNDEKPKNREMKLPYPMMSLDKIKNFDDLMSWMKKFPKATFIITPKYDGLSVGMDENRSWTRGDGTTGQDCTEHVSAIYLKPFVAAGDVIRGEIIIDNSDWNRFKEINESAKSQRNSATGLINGDFDNSRGGEYALLRVMPYEIQGSCGSKENQLEALMNHNYEKIINPYYLSEEMLLNMFVSWKQLYPIDGLVIDVNEDEYRHSVEANGNPSYSVAYKHPSFSEVGYGVIDRIERSVNRDGVVTPVLVLKEPINLAGADIQRVSGINMRYVHDWMLYPGEKVTVIRSGEVIPKIIGVGRKTIPFREEFKTTKEYEEAYANAVDERKTCVTMSMVDSYEVNSLDECPICGGYLERVYGPDGDWCEMACVNGSCRGKKLASIVKFFEIAGVDGFGEKTFTQLFENGLIDNYFEVFGLTYNDLIGLDGWAAISVNKFLNEIIKVQISLPFARFLHATGWFSDLGEKTLQKIIDARGMDNCNMEYLLTIEGVKEITAQKFIDGYEKLMFWDELVKDFKFSYVMTPVSEGPLNGMVVCATGFRNQEMFSKIEELGGVVGDGVTKNTTCLIVKDLSSNSSKMKKAEKMGIEILDIDGFNTKYLK